MGHLDLFLDGPLSQQERAKPGTEDILVRVTITADLPAKGSHQTKPRASVGSDWQRARTQIGPLSWPVFLRICGDLELKHIEKRRNIVS